MEMSNNQRAANNNVKGIEPTLHRAALCGSFDEMISSNYDWQKKISPTGNNILHIHVGKPVVKKPEKVIHIEFVEKVLNCEGGYQLLWKENDKGDTPLHLAARFGHTNVVKLFLERAAVVGNPQELMRISNKRKDTALHEAARRGYVDVVKLLVIADDPTCLHQPNDMCETPLYLATESGSDPSVAVILDTCSLSALPNHRGPCGRTPLHAAVNLGSPEMVKKMLEHDSRLMRNQDDEGLTPFHRAARNGKYSQQLKILLHYDENNRNNESSAVYIQDNEGCTALHVAVQLCNWDAVKILIASCPDCIEITDNKGQNVVHYAAQWVCLAKFRNFLQLGYFDSLANGKDVNGNTPLHIFAKSISSYPGHTCLFNLLPYMNKDPLIDPKAVNNKNLTFCDVIASTCYEYRSLLSETILFKIYRESPKSRRLNSYENVADVDEAMEANVRELEAEVSSIKRKGEIRLVVPALIATVSFTSALTLPGGFNQNPGKNMGMAVLTSKAAFKAFLISDVIAFICSVTAILLYYVLTSSYDIYGTLGRFYLANTFTAISLGALGIALTTGVTAVIPHSPVLVIILWVISAIFFIGYIPLLLSTVRNLTSREARCIVDGHKISGRISLDSVFAVIRSCFYEL